MSRTAQTKTTSRLVRRTTSAPKALRVITGGKQEDGKQSATEAAPAARTGVQHQDFATACLPHQQEMYGVAMRICRDPDNAKDLVQETLMRAMVAWQSFERGTNLRAWLFRIL